MPPKPFNRSGATPDEPSKGQIRQTNEVVILTAAERVFAGAGFAGATMAAIAEAAGLPKANLHYYFGSKQDLYHAVLARTLEDWLMPLNAITQRPTRQRRLRSTYGLKWPFPRGVRTPPKCLPMSCCMGLRWSKTC